MKLFVYSSELLTFVEAKWMRAKYAVGGILIVTIILSGAMTVKSYVGDPPESRSANGLAEENDLLRQELGRMSPRVNKLEILAGQLQVRADGLHRLLLRRSVMDTITRLTNALTSGRIPIGGVREQPADLQQRPLMNVGSMSEGSRSDSMLANGKQY